MEFVTFGPIDDSSGETPPCHPGVTNESNERREPKQKEKRKKKRKEKEKRKNGSSIRAGRWWRRKGAETRRRGVSTQIGLAQCRSHGVRRGVLEESPTPVQEERVGRAREPHLRTRFWQLIGSSLNLHLSAIETNSEESVFCLREQKSGEKHRIYSKTKFVLIRGYL